MNLRHTPAIVSLAVALAACNSWSTAGTITVPYWNSFSGSASDFTVGTTSNAVWTHDPTLHVYRTVITAASTESFATVTASNLGGPAATADNFWVSSDFSINQLSGGPATVGLRALTTYIADIQEGGGMRIWGGSLSTSVIDTFTGGLEAGTVYTMTLAGTYFGDALRLEFSVTDGNQTTTVARDISSPASGRDFGFRNRTSATYAEALNVDFHNLTIIPEPSSALLALLAMVGGMTVCSRQRRKE